MGSDVVVTVGPAVMMMERAFDGEVAPVLSWTVALKLKVPAALGVPVIAPLDAFSDKPPGSAPLVTSQLL